MVAAREGMTLSNDKIACSQIPSSRKLINFIGSGRNFLYILNENLCRDIYGKEALTLLRHNNILKP